MSTWTSLPTMFIARSKLSRSAVRISVLHRESTYLNLSALITKLVQNSTRTSSNLSPKPTLLLAQLRHHLDKPPEAEVLLPKSRSLRCTSVASKSRQKRLILSSHSRKPMKRRLRSSWLG
jgi:hypothetical protein